MQPGIKVVRVRRERKEVWEDKKRAGRKESRPDTGSFKQNSSEKMETKGQRGTLQRGKGEPYGAFPRSAREGLGKGKGGE